MNTPVDHRIKERWEKVEERYEGDKYGIHVILPLSGAGRPVIIPARLKD